MTLLASVGVLSATTPVRAAEPSVSVLDTGAVTVTLKNRAQHRASATLTLLNPGAKPAPITVELQALSSGKMSVTERKPKSVAPGAQQVKLTFAVSEAPRNKAQGAAARAERRRRADHPCLDGQADRPEFAHLDARHTGYCPGRLSAGAGRRIAGGLAHGAGRATGGRRTRPEMEL